MTPDRYIHGLDDPKDAPRIFVKPSVYVETLEERLIAQGFTEAQIAACFAEPAEYATRPRPA